MWAGHPPSILRDYAFGSCDNRYLIVETDIRIQDYSLFYPPPPNKKIHIILIMEAIYSTIKFFSEKCNLDKA
jgi:hypothetical protein